MKPKVDLCLENTLHTLYIPQQTNTMEDTMNPHLSIALYRYLCRNIVGTEDQVKRIRHMNAVRDNIESRNGVRVITSGSFGEGLEMRGSDIDRMKVLPFSVSEDLIHHLNPSKLSLIMEREDVKPCYTLLRLESINNQKFFNLCEVYNGSYYLSSALYQQYYAAGEGRTIHGPCITFTNGLIDDAFCLHCETWISPAVQWITRSSNAWPSNDVKHSIIKHGVILVPIGVKESPKEDIEWRLSFSVGEKLLINTFTHTQLLCYALLKIMLKDVIGTESKCKDLLCSYFLKTIIFWISEELPISIWTPDNTIPCFMRCFSRLVYCVEHAVCFHYFIPENNLFENKIEGRAREILLEKLHALYSYGWRCILFSDQLSNFQVSMWNLHIEPRTLHLNDFKYIPFSQFLYILDHFFVPCCIKMVSTFKNGIFKTLRCQQSSIKDIYKYYVSMCYGGLAQLISLNSTCSNNKYRYKQYNSCLSFLLQNVYHDAVSGWLMIASLFYKTKQYSKALHTIMYSISKCTPEKVCLTCNMPMLDYQFQKFTFVHLEKIIRVDDIKIKTDSFLIPDELQMEDSTRSCWLPSTSYAYFLEFLCHYHLNNVRQCQDSLQGLQLVIEESYLISRDKFKEFSYNLLEMASHLLGQMNSHNHSYNLLNDSDTN